MREFKVTVVRNFGDIITHVWARSLKQAREIVSRKWEVGYQFTTAVEV